MASHACNYSIHLPNQGQESILLREKSLAVGIGTVHVVNNSHLHFLFKGKSSIEESFRHVISDREIGWKFSALFDHNRINSIQHLPTKLHVCGPPGSIVDLHLWVSKDGSHLLIIVQICDLLRLQFYLGCGFRGRCSNVDILDLLESFIMRQIICTIINV